MHLDGGKLCWRVMQKERGRGGKDMSESDRKSFEDVRQEVLGRIKALKEAAARHEFIKNAFDADIRRLERRIKAMEIFSRGVGAGRRVTVAGTYILDVLGAVATWIKEYA